MEPSSSAHARRGAPRRGAIGTLASLALVSLLAAGCGEKAAPPPPKPAEPRASTALDATLIVHPPDEGGKRRAVVDLRAKEAVATVDISFGLPADCRTVAGARKRDLGAVPAGQQKQSFIQFECPAGAAGEVTLSVTGTDEAGGTIDKQLASSL
jgi:hypothetical protein